MSEHPPLIEINSDNDIRTVVFTANGEYLVSGGDEVQVWRVKDGERMARMDVRRRTVFCLAVSKDGRWIAAGTQGGQVYVWDAKTYEQAFTHEERSDINGVDFSPDSTRLVAGSDDSRAIVWDVTARQQVLGPLEHQYYVIAVKYSPQGDRIATATYLNESVRVYNSNDGCLLVDIPIKVTPLFNTGLLWSKDQIFVISDGKIKQVEASIGSIISEWPVPDNGSNQKSIAQSLDKEFLAYFAGSTTVMFWDTSMHSQFGLIHHTRPISSITFSPNDRLLAIGEEGRKTIIYDVSSITIPFMDVSDTVLGLWMQDRLDDVEALLTRTITSSDHPSHHVHANRALVRARLRYWDAAIEDAEKSINIQPSVIGYIAKSLALIGGGNKEEVRRVYDLASRHIQLYDVVDPLLLIKAVVLFMAGEHDDAISRINDLISTLHSGSIYYVVQAHMYLLRGNSQMDNNNHEDTIKSYEHALTQIRSYGGPHLRTIELISGWKFDGLGITIRQRLCEALYAVGRTKEAGECLVEIVNSFDEEVYVRGSVPKWVSDFTRQYASIPEENWTLDFKQNCALKILRFGDAAANAPNHEDAVIHYSAALSLEPGAPQDVLVKRSKAQAALGLWEDALNDANEVIVLDPASPWGYERKYVAFGVAGHHKEMSNTFETMLSKMAQSDNPVIRERGQQYPRTKETIRGVIHGAIRDVPRVLISTISGRLYDKSEQAVAFELSPAYAELTSSMTTLMDLAHIEQEVTKYYRYAMLSYRYEGNEPPFEEVINTAVYELENSPTHDKLQKFCKIVRDAGFHWAWSSTCCVDTADHSVLQEALASMFRWYQESALTIILLLDVFSPSERGALMRSIWNTRAWMFQEYHASKIVRFYNSDWTLYRNLDIPNHKESPEIISEVEEATGMSAEALVALRPGLGDIREKLRLVSKRETTLVEDAAYSLFGIFSLSLPVVYGEGDKALGHLLSQLFTKSGDTSVLAWIGTSGTFNSCLPSNTVAFHEPSASHIQPALEDAEMDAIAAGLRASSLNIAFLMKLMDRLNELPAPWFAGQEMKLPCMILKVGPVSTSDGVFHMQTATLGDVEIRTREDLSRFDSLYLVHPWIDFLLDRPPVGSDKEAREEDTDDDASAHEVLAFPGRSNVPLTAIVQKRAARLVARLKRIRRSDRSMSPPREAATPELPTSSSQGDKQMQAVRFAARLKQPYEVLLFASDAGNKYRRVAADSRIAVQVGDITAPVLKQLVDGVRVLDVV